jgi:hypothetical protein
VFRESEISQFDDESIIHLCDNDVVRMQIPKHNPALPQKHQPLHNLPHNNRDFFLAEASVLHFVNCELEQWATIAIIHKHIKMIRISVVVSDIHNVFVSLAVMGGNIPRF